VHLVRTPDGRQAGIVERTEVRFRPYDERWIRWYVATREPFGKAGAYGIQGLGALLCEEIRGSWTNVVGLPVEALPHLFAGVGVDLLQCLEDGGSAACPDLGILSPGDRGRTS
jgi:predicted house-cleaning NTP pyrophosphatase (Maf/HAM1 superfamily)